MCLDLFRGGTQGKQRSSWIKPTGNSLSCSYRECIKFSAFRACVSQRSVSASSSALNCSQVSLLGAPIKPASRESVFAEAQKGNCVAFVCTIPKGTCLCSELSHCPSLGGSGATASLCHCHVCLGVRGAQQQHNPLLLQLSFLPLCWNGSVKHTLRDLPGTPFLE